GPILAAAVGELFRVAAVLVCAPEMQCAGAIRRENQILSVGRNRRPDIRTYVARLLPGIAAGNFNLPTVLIAAVTGGIDDLPVRLPIAPVIAVIFAGGN